MWWRRLGGSSSGTASASTRAGTGTTASGTGTRTTLTASARPRTRARARARARWRTRPYSWRRNTGRGDRRYCRLLRFPQSMRMQHPERGAPEEADQHPLGVKLILARILDLLFVPLNHRVGLFQPIGIESHQARV